MQEHCNNSIYNFQTNYNFVPSYTISSRAGVSRGLYFSPPLVLSSVEEVPLDEDSINTVSSLLSDDDGSNPSLSSCSSEGSIP